MSGWTVRRLLFCWFAATVAILALAGSRPSASTGGAAQPTILEALQNLAIDPLGRVVDVTLDAPLDLQLPDDNIRFEIDLVRPLGRDISFCIADFNQDGRHDLLGRSFDGGAYFYAGLDEHPYRFGEGIAVRLTNAGSGIPYQVGLPGHWEGCAVADLDGDGLHEVVIGTTIYTLPVPGDPRVLSLADSTSLEPPVIFDRFPSAGDLTGDGLPEVVITSGGRAAWLFRNQSSPGNFNFEMEQLTDSYRRNFAGERGLSMGDLNQDGLLDLLSFGGIYYNQGTAGDAQFDFTDPSPYSVHDGPWVNGVSSDQGISIFLEDGDGDGLLDAFVCSTGNSVWQGSYYRNIGIAGAPAFRFEGPLLARSTPFNNYYRGHEISNISGERAFATPADPNRDGRPDLLISDFVLWNRSTGNPDFHFAHMDIYTFEGEHLELQPYDFFNPHWLPLLTVSWKDYTADGLEDVIQADTEGDLSFPLFFHERSGNYPVRFNEGERLLTQAGSEMSGLGWAEMDLNGDGVLDTVVGNPSSFDRPELDGQLMAFIGSGSNGELSFADPVPVTDPLGEPIDVTENAWPAAFDWDNDGEQDLLVASQSGNINIFLNQNGTFVFAGLLGIEGWDPVDFTSIVGGGLISPVIATADFNQDGLTDLLVGDTQFSSLWYFRNTGADGLSRFEVQLISVDRTIPGRVEPIGDSKYRLYFSIPPIAGETSVVLYDGKGIESGREVVQIEEELKRYFPCVRISPDGFTGIAVSNFSGKPVDLRFEAFNEDGTRAAFPFNPAEFRLEEDQQLALLGHQIFGADPSIEALVWVELTSSHSGIGSFYQFGPNDLGRLDGSVAFSRSAEDLFLTRVFEGEAAFRGQPATTTLYLVNPHSEPIETLLTLRIEEGRNDRGTPTPVSKTFTLPAKGALFDSVRAIFGDRVSVQQGRIDVEVTAGPGAVAFQTIELIEQNSVIGLNAAVRNLESELFSAQLASTPEIYTNLNFVNQTGFRRLRLTAVDLQGVELPAKELILFPGEQVSMDAAEFLDLFAPQGGAEPDVFVGSLRVEVDGPGVSGDVIFGERNGLDYAAALPLESKAIQKAVFSHVANLPDFFTGLAFYAPKGSPQITLRVVAPDGTPIGTGTRKLQSGQRISELLAEIVPDSQGQQGGRILIEGTDLFIAQLLFGALDEAGRIKLFSAVPPNVIE